MNEDKYFELMNKVIDGEASEHEKKTLSDYLASHPKAAKQYAELKGAAKALDEAGLMKPPVDLKQKVMSSISRDLHHARSGAGIISRLFAGMRTGAGARYACTFVAGAAFGILILALITGVTKTGWLDNSDLYGTAILKRGGGSFEITGENHFKVGESAGVIAARANYRTAIAKIEIESINAADLILRFDQRELGFVSFGQDEEMQGTCEVGADSVAFSHSGSNVYTVVLKKRIECGSYFELTINSDGEEYSTKMSACAESCIGDSANE
jgi:hypothetical protein